MEHKITDVRADEVCDSRGNPTLHVTVFAGEMAGSFSVPSGASTGSMEAMELRDGEGGGAHVAKAIANIVGPIKDKLMDMDVFDQKMIDRTMVELDGTPQKSNLGGNAMIGVSIATARVASRVRGTEIYEYLRNLRSIKPSRDVPFLYSNLVNGGKHAKSHLAFQEFMVVPNVAKASEALSMLIEIEKSLGEIVRADYGNVKRGDEGGYALDIKDVSIPLELLTRAVKKVGVSEKIRFALDVAASSFFDSNLKKYKVGDDVLSREELLAVYKLLVNKFPIFSIEDPFEENDFEGFALLRKELSKLIVVGDDLTVTNKAQLEKAIDKNSVNAIIIKPNQIGTLTEVLDAMELARNNNIECIVSHRSGETEDSFIADMAYAFGTFGLKSGAPVPKERLAKYNNLILNIK